MSQFLHEDDKNDATAIVIPPKTVEQRISSKRRRDVLAHNLTLYPIELTFR